MQFQGLIGSMEDIDNTPAVDESEAAETAVAVADNSTEVQAESDQAAVTVAQVEDAVQAGEELESIGEVAVEAVESGEGMDETSAELASIAIESIRSRLGIRSETRLVPSCESFGNTNTKMMSTKLVVEGITDTIKSIWKAIKAAALRVWEILKSFFAKLFNSASMLSKHIQGLRERARSMPAGSAPKEKTIKSAGVAKAFSISGKADYETVKTITENTASMVDVAGKIGKEQLSVSNAASALASSDINSANVSAFLKAQAAASDNVTAAVKVFKATTGDLAAIPAKGPKNSKTTANYTYGPFVGNVVLNVSHTQSELLGQKAVRAHLSFIPAKGKVAESVKALSLNEVQEMLGTAAKVANTLADWKKVQGEYEAITKAVNKVADVVMNSATKLLSKTGSDTETRLGLQELKTEVSATVSTLGSFGNRAPALTFSLAKAMADYASLSMRNLQEGK